MGGIIEFEKSKMSRKKNRLIKNGFLTENGKTVTLTPKGLDLLKMYL
jgi:predicted transcriptional regulator